MYLKAIEMAGFKSFAKKAALSFTSPISSIVGPNGSGKSNVAEAFRFVLGEQSIKSMRGKRGEDLIFNGGEGGSRINRASVKVVFDNKLSDTRGTRDLAIDFDEVTIERVVHRDSSNEYFINGSQVRLKDVIELLAGAHIGASGHHIISQGEADRILSSSMRERREMVEDALGLKIYQYKKAESLRKLEKTDENIKSVESLRREVAPHLKFLKKQVEKVEKMEEMRRNLRALYREYLYREHLFVTHEKQRLDMERQAPLDELTNLAKERKSAETLLSSTKKDDVVSAEMIQLQKSIDTCRSKREEVSREIGRIEGEVNSLRRMIVKERERENRDEHKTVLLKDVDSLVKELELEIGKALDLAGRSDADPTTGLKSVSEILHTVRASARAFIESKREKVDNVAVSEAEADVLAREAEKSVALKLLEEVTAEEKKLEGDFTNLRRKIESDKDSTREAERRVFVIVARENELRGVVNSINSKLEAVKLIEQAYERELNEAHIIGGRDAVNTHSFKESPECPTTETILAEPRFQQENRRKEIEKYKIRLEDSGVGNSGEIIKEFKETQERDVFLGKELTDLFTAKQSLHGLISELDVKLNTEFKDGIYKINTQFQHFFSLMFGGGSAKLDLVKEEKRKRRNDFNIDIDGENMPDSLISSSDSGSGQASEDEANKEIREGIEIAVSLPRKKVKSLMMLSGGERALTSIALLFAISQVKPPPFIILDETDAALDEANSRKYGDMIESLSKYSQLILITHNRETMSRAGVLYGVTMSSDGGSKVLSIAFDEAARLAK